MTRVGAARARVARNRARRRTAGALAVALVAAGLGYAAVASDGSTVHEADLNDAGVWVSSAQQAKFAKANVPIGQLDTGVATDASAGAGLDVLQDGAVVLGLNTGTGELFPLDARTSTAGEPAALVAAVTGAKGRFVPRPVDLRGGTLAVLDPASGKVFAQRVDPKAGTSTFPDVAVGAEPVATVGKKAAIAVGVDGVIHAVSGVDGTVTTIAPTPTGFGAPVVVDTALRSALPDVTAVGAAWVAYDAETDRVFTASAPEGADAQVTVDGNRVAALQQPGPDADTVVVESAQRAAQVPLDGGTSPGGVVVGDQVNRVPGATLITRPVVLGGCVHAAWAEQNRVFYGANCGRAGDEPTATLPADGEEPTRDGVAFRVNRGLVVLNDLDNGGVWDLDDKPTKIDNWDALTPPTRQDDENDKKDENLLDEAALQQPPTATPDSLQVRPGRTSKLHVLDNDTDVAGSVLAIDQRDVTAPTLDGVAASVSADGQAIDVSVPEGTENRSFEFSYKVNNGKAVSKESAKVTVRVVPDSVNGAPALRQGGAKLAAQVYPVIAGKRLSVPVLADWRDPENDVLAARADVEGAVVDGQGRVTLSAPTTEGKQPVPYVVTDGRGGTTRGTVNALVISPSGDSRFVAPKTQPDAVRGVVGKPLQVEPLGNDVAGADPGEPDATLRLRSEVRPVGPLQVDTDLATGQVTVTGSAPGTFELSYSATTGAGAAPGRIRVDLVAPPEGAPPVSVPDTATLHDQAPAMVDVLANDYSPRGDVLVTASASSTGDSSWIQPSIYQGRWVRLEATSPAPAGDQGRRGTVTYTVSDGTQRVTGQVSVLQQGAITDSLPIVVDDTATVREGDTVSVPVLDNDTMADGIPLRLDPGSVKVISEGDAQRAFASGNVIRYVPEATGLTAEKFVTIEYAAYADGMKERAQTARVRVQVTPLPSPQRINQAPVARSFTATVTAGDPLTMTVPTFGVDPDGDSVSVAGVVGKDGTAVDLTYGRVVGIGPSTIKYEAYPLAAGTEVITYEVTDRFGATSQAYVRVGVVQPGDPQPPVAVADEVFAAPGKTVTVKPLVNDLIARGDVVEVDVESLNDAATRKDWDVDADHVVTTTVPADTTALHQLVYGISDGLFDPSRASILVRAVKDWVNPPVANDDVAAPKPGETSTLVDVLANDTDVDSDPATLKIVDVLSSSAVIENRPGPGAGARPPVLGAVRHRGRGRRAGDGPGPRPHGRERAAVRRRRHGDPDGPRLDRDRRAGRAREVAPWTGGLGDHRRHPLRLPGREPRRVDDRQPHARADLVGRVRRPRGGHARGHRPGRRRPEGLRHRVRVDPGPDRAEGAAAALPGRRRHGHRRRPRPHRRHPDLLPRLAAGGDEPGRRHVRHPVGERAGRRPGRRRPRQPHADAARRPGREELDRSAERHLARPGLALDHRRARGRRSRRRFAGGGPGPAADAAADQRHRAEGGRVAHRRRASLPRLPTAATRVLDHRRQRRVRDRADRHRLGLPPHPRRRREALAHGIRRDHRQRRPGPHGAGPGLRDDARAPLGPPTGHRRRRPRRRRPGARVVAATRPTTAGPSSPRTSCATAGAPAARPSAAPPRARSPGSPTARTTGSPSPRSTGSARASSRLAERAGAPDRLPEQVTGVRMVTRGDGTLTIGWDQPVNEGSALRKYVVRLISSTGQTKTQDVAAATRQAVVTGLDNMAEQSVQVQAWNELGAGQFGPAVTMQSAGTPPALPQPAIQASGPGPAKDSATLTISWDQGSPNGPPTTKYTLYRAIGTGAWAAVQDGISPGTRTTTDTIPYDGRTYRYTVTLTNGAGLEGPKSELLDLHLQRCPVEPVGQRVDPDQRPEDPAHGDRRSSPTPPPSPPSAGPAAGSRAPSPAGAPPAPRRSSTSARSTPTRRRTTRSRCAPRTPVAASRARRPPRRRPTGTTLDPDRDEREQHRHDRRALVVEPPRERPEDRPGPARRCRQRHLRREQDVALDQQRPGDLHAQGPGALGRRAGPGGRPRRSSSRSRTRRSTTCTRALASGCPTAAGRVPCRRARRCSSTSTTSPSAAGAGRSP